MAENVNKVEYYGKVLLDLTEDTVTAETLAEGAVAHDASGKVITGVGKTTSVLYTEQTLTEAQQTQARSNIGAAASGDIPTKVSELTNDSGYITGYTETDPTVPSWAKAASKPSYTASEVGADASGTAASAVSSHNTSTSAHNDIRTLITGLTNRLNALANSDDTTLDQMAELVAYIKSNRSLIDNVTTNKVNVADIVNDLTTNSTTKVLSAAQGVALKALIDGLTVPTKTSELTNDSGFITSHQDISGKLDKSGGTMSGALVAQNNANYTTKQVRNVFLVAEGESLPSGANGDICLIYTP